MGKRYIDYYIKRTLGRYRVHPVLTLISNFDTEFVDSRLFFMSNHCLRAPWAERNKNETSVEKQRFRANF